MIKVAEKKYKLPFAILYFKMTLRRQYILCYNIIYLKRIVSIYIYIFDN